jgi:hypothetical protein
MKPVFLWLEELKKQYTSSNNASTVSDEELANFNKKFAEINNFAEFLVLQKEIVDRGNLTFATAIDGKTCVLNQFSILIHSEKEGKFSRDHAMNQKNPESVVRYFIYDQKVIRIRSRMCNVEMLKKSLKVIRHDWSYYSKFAEDLKGHFSKKVEEINIRASDDKYRSSMLDRTLKSLDRAKALIA